MKGISGNNIILSLIYSILLLFSAINCSSLILEPVNKNTSNEEVGFIFIQGAGLESEKYVSLSKQIQESNKDLNTWISITNSFFDLPLSIIATKAIEESYSDLLSRGFNKNSQIYLIGHSLGGVAGINYYIANEQNQKEKKNISGLIMLGSIPERSLREQSKNLNILILGGELDGLSRITRLAEEFYHSNLDNEKKNVLSYAFNTKKNSNQLNFLEESDLIFLENKNQNKTNISNIVLEGLNHMSFASGSPTTFVSLRDLRSEVPMEIGHKTISEIINNFIKKNNLFIQNELNRTYAFLKPLIEAFEMEGSIHFNRPDQTTCHRGYCSKGSDWTIEAQKILSQEKLINQNGLSMNITNDFVILSSLPPLGDLFHPKMRKTNKDFNIATFSQCSWDIVDKLVDAGFASISASEIGSKMYSRQCSLVYGTNKKKEDTPISIDSQGNICKQINQKALDWAVERSHKNTLKRFDFFGQKLNFVNDTVYSNGFSWTYSILNMSNENEDGDLNVQSFTMYTDIDAKPLPIFAPDGLDCYHYCKLLSPARAMEWIYVDGLRKKYHI